MSRVLKSVLTAIVALFLITSVDSRPGASTKSLADLKLTVLGLRELVQAMQVKRDRPFVAPGLWQEDKGIYPSYVRLNFVGLPEEAELRELISVFDNNMFATAWITTALLESHRYATAPRPSDTQLLSALDAIAKHRDRNVPYVSSVMAFWPQAYNNETGMWVSTPANLLDAFDVFEALPWDKIDNILEKLGLQDVEKLLEQIKNSRSMYTRAFQIPGDFDDTFVNLGLGTLLVDMADDLPQALARWKENNANVSSVLDALRRYAYRPFSKDETVNTIDTRTYYYLRHFLDYAKSKGLDVALVPTWVQNVDEARLHFNSGVVMPLQINNVDVTVAANAVYGLTASVLTGLLPESVLNHQTDPVIAQVYHNTTTMIAFMIENGLFGRPDLALTYYPSVFEFYWFVARTFHRMELAMQKGALPKVMQELFPVLKSALEGAMTRHVTGSGTEEGEDEKYYDDFLGDGDFDSNHTAKIKGEDRLYTTTMAVNALLTTWTLNDPITNTVTWRPGTPDDVKVTSAKCVKWLSKNILGIKYKPWNAFFSGSVKGYSTFPMQYPGNRLVLLNGTRIYDYSHFPKNFCMYGAEGYIPEKEYEDLVKNKKTHFNEPTTINFTTYNDPSVFFPFWSSPAYTYATAMLALGRYDSIQA